MFSSPRDEERGLSLLPSLHPFLCFTQLLFCFFHALFMFMTNTDYSKYFTVPTISFLGSLISVCCAQNFFLFMYYLPGAVVYTL